MQNVLNHYLCRINKSSEKNIRKTTLHRFKIGPSKRLKNPKPIAMSMRQLKITKSITNRESQSLEKYLQEIGKVELIGPEEEVRLARMIKHGDQVALDKLTKANLRFVV